MNKEFEVISKIKYKQMKISTEIIKCTRAEIISKLKIHENFLLLNKGLLFVTI